MSSGDSAKIIDREVGSWPYEARYSAVSEESEESRGKISGKSRKLLELARENEPLPAALRLRRVYRYLGDIRLSK
jgi:hypothetical protein